MSEDNMQKAEREMNEHLAREKEARQQSQKGGK